MNQHRFLFAYHADADNIGDRECSPGRHIEFPAAVVSKMKIGLPKADTIIIGGGAIFGAMEKYMLRGVLGEFGRAIAWGVGLPYGRANLPRIRKVSAEYASFSTRDYNWHQDFMFVPCASCLSPDFDDLPAPSTDVVLYLHKKKTDSSKYISASAPLGSNDFSSLKSALRFLAQGETIVTNSYHGVYWAQLMGRKVLCIPYGKKFFTYQDQPSFSSEIDWRNDLSFARRLPSRLEEYRDINLRFMDSALGLKG